MTRKLFVALGHTFPPDMYKKKSFVLGCPALIPFLKFPGSQINTKESIWQIELEITNLLNEKWVAAGRDFIDRKKKSD